MPLPKISIVTPSYNQAQFVVWTARSVLLQRYPNLEYIWMDGGSKDNTVEVLKPYVDRFAYFVSGSLVLTAGYFPSWKMLLPRKLRPDSIEP